MADNKQWFKVWVAILNDPDFLDMELETVGRWALLHAFVAQHGNSGKMIVSKKALSIVLRCNNDEAQSVTMTLPNVDVKSYPDDNGDKLEIRIKHWDKYQMNSQGYNRVKAHREKKKETQKITPVCNAREEERRRENIKKKEYPLISPVEDKHFDTFWSAYPKKIGKSYCKECWKKIGVNDELLAIMLAAIESAKKMADWQRDEGRAIPNPSTWLNQKRWEDENSVELSQNGASQDGLIAAMDEQASKGRI